MFLFMGLLSLISDAYPCAGLIHEEDSLAESDAQEVILRTDGINTTVEYLVSFYGDSESFGWIIPIFGEIVRNEIDEPLIEDGDESYFHSIRSITQPIVVAEYASSGSGEEGGCGCGAGMSKGDAANGFGDEENLAVVDVGVTGAYEYTILDASDETALHDWLTENNWQLGTTEASIQNYVEEGDVYFIAIRLNEIAISEKNQNLPPIKISYQGINLRFPAKMARYSEEDEIRTTIYILGDQHANIAAWQSEEINSISGSLDDDATELYDARLREIGGLTTGYGLVYSNTYGNDWLTRYDTLSAPSAHTLDPTFTLDGGELRIDTEIYLSGSSQERSDHRGMIVLPLMLMGFGMWRRGT